MIKRFFHSLKWQYGTCRADRARRNRFNGEVQFILWKAGEQGHKEDYWHALHSDWWPGFVPNKV